MRIRSTFLSFQLSSKHCADNKSECTEYERVKDELNKELERCLGDHTSNPSNGQRPLIVAERRGEHTKDKSGPSYGHIGLLRDNDALCPS